MAGTTDGTQHGNSTDLLNGLPATAVETTGTGVVSDVVGIILYGSVARGEADRRSDIDLWILARPERAESQREANAIARDLKTRSSMVTDTPTISMSRPSRLSRHTPKRYERSSFQGFWSTRHTMPSRWLDTIGQA
ncbi:Minimal nucleotidyltransferase (plasmid) [Halapricum desulfuricans]|uniref:Minimal nucleotidyltransferase n=1 Tax=Halapricum desulfuricans TaxID=2841257 RepID=A0A897NW12_9EURY|nr:Minimal nucleotidyltransferase [Halapricum desulfuricans]